MTEQFVIADILRNEDAKELEQKIMTERVRLATPER